MLSQVFASKSLEHNKRNQSDHCINYSSLEYEQYKENQQIMFHQTSNNSICLIKSFKQNYDIELLNENITHFTHCGEYLILLTQNNPQKIVILNINNFINENNDNNHTKNYNPKEMHTISENDIIETVEIKSFNQSLEHFETNEQIQSLFESLNISSANTNNDNDNNNENELEPP